MSTKPYIPTHKTTVTTTFPSSESCCYFIVSAQNESTQQILFQVGNVSTKFDMY